MNEPAVSGSGGRCLCLPFHQQPQHGMSTVLHLQTSIYQMHYTNIITALKHSQRAPTNTLSFISHNIYNNKHGNFKISPRSLSCVLFIRYRRGFMIGDQVVNTKYCHEEALRKHVTCAASGGERRATRRPPSVALYALLLLSATKDDGFPLYPLPRCSLISRLNIICPYPLSKVRRNIHKIIKIPSIIVPISWKC